MRQWQSLRRSLGHGVDPATRLGRRRGVVRRRTDSQEWNVPAARLEAVEPGEFEIDRKASFLACAEAISGETLSHGSPRTNQTVQSGGGAEIPPAKDHPVRLIRLRQTD